MQLAAVAHAKWGCKLRTWPHGLQGATPTILVCGCHNVASAPADFSLLQGEPEKAARAVFLGVRLVLQEVAAQAPAAQLLVLGLPPLQLALEDGGRWAGMGAAVM